VRSVLRIALLVLPLAAVLGGCEETFLSDPVLVRDTATMSTPTSALTFPSAIDLADGNAPRRPELPVNAEIWDFQLRASGGGLVLFPNPGRATQRGAGILPTTEDFEQIDDAPRGRSAYAETAVPLQVGRTFFAHTRDISATGCYKYAKLKVVEVDVAAERARIAVVSNQGCDDERLKGDDDDEL
jgi:hypothetical protein